MLLWTYVPCLLSLGRMRIFGSSSIEIIAAHSPLVLMAPLRFICPLVSKWAMHEKATCLLTDISLGHIPAHHAMAVEKGSILADCPFHDSDPASSVGVVKWQDDRVQLFIE